MDAIGGYGVTTFCAPPTVWRMLIQADLSACDVTALRECVAAGEPLNPEVIDQVRRAWEITVRDGYGQTETTAQVGNTPGQPLRPGSMGRPLPGYTVALVDPLSGEPGQEGEICLDLARRPLGLMTGYRGDEERAAEAMRGGYYHTGDVASRDAEGYLTYIGRTDDVTYVLNPTTLVVGGTNHDHQNRTKAHSQHTAKSRHRDNQRAGSATGRYPRLCRRVRAQSRCVDRRYGRERCYPHS
jgi:acyl-coenzyme A synthetase/AMP-(fatty) acid ligase